MLRSAPGEVAGVALLRLLLLLLLLLQGGLDLLAHIHGDLQDLTLAVDGEDDLLTHRGFTDEIHQL